MNIQETIARSLYSDDYRHAKWEDQDQNTKDDYLNAATNLIVNLANNRLYISIIPGSETEEELEEIRKTNERNEKKTPMKGRSQF